MAKTDFKSVGEYIAAQPKTIASVLTKVRALLKKALPKAEEGISYQIPTYKLDGRAALYFAGYPSHFSLYPASERVLKTLGAEAKARLASKATLRFALDEPLPQKLIERVAAVRAQEVSELAKTKQSKLAKRANQAKAASPRAKTKTAAKTKAAKVKGKIETRPKRRVRG